MDQQTPPATPPDRTRPIAAIAAIVIVVAVIIGAVALFGGDEAPVVTDPTTTTTIPTTTTEAPTTTLAEATGEPIAPNEPLNAGQYLIDELNVPFSIQTPDDGWRVLPSGDGNGVVLCSPTDCAPSLVFDLAPHPSLEVPADPDEMVDAFEMDEALEVENPSRTRVGGAPGWTGVLTLIEDSARGACLEPCAAVVGGDGFPEYNLFGGDVLRFWVVDVDGTTVTILAALPATSDLSLEAFTTLTNAIVSSVGWDQ